MRGRRLRGVSDATIGLVAIVLVLGGAFFAFTQANPFANPYELEAVFESAQNLKPRSPVRIAGVDVGEVKSVEDAGNGRARVKMELQDSALPIHSDAEAKVVPRLFLEGNFVVDLSPGTPSAPELESGAVLPPERTAHSVSFEQILKVLDKDSRAALQTLLDEYTRALVTGGASGFNRSIRFWEPAYRNTAIASEAFLGTRAGDLRRVLRGQQRTFAALSRDPEVLKQLITDLNATARAFAREDVALEASIPALRDVLRAGSPALASLNTALPSLRAFARDALPGVRSSTPTLRVSQPFITQLRRLFQPSELRGLSADLREAIPSLAKVNSGAVDLFTQQRLLASCTNDVLIPFAATPVPDPDFPEQNNEPFFRTSGRAMVGLAGESRSGDANGQWFRLNAGSGPTTIVLPGGENTETLFAQTGFPQLGARPAKPARRPQFRPDVPCETQENPDLSAALGSPNPTVTPSAKPTAATRRRDAAAQRTLRKVTDYLEADRAGKRAKDPFTIPPLEAKESDE